MFCIIDNVSYEYNNKFTKLIRLLNPFGKIKPNIKNHILQYYSIDNISVSLSTVQQTFDVNKKS